MGYQHSEMLSRAYKSIAWFMIGLLLVLFEHISYFFNSIISLTDSRVAQFFYHLISTGHRSGAFVTLATVGWVLMAGTSLMILWNAVKIGWFRSMDSASSKHQSEFPFRRVGFVFLLILVIAGAGYLFSSESSPFKGSKQINDMTRFTYLDKSEKPETMVRYRHMVTQSMIVSPISSNKDKHIVRSDSIILSVKYGTGYFGFSKNRINKPLRQYQEYIIKNQRRLWFSSNNRVFIYLTNYRKTKYVKSAEKILKWGKPEKSFQLSVKDLRTYFDEPNAVFKLKKLKGKPRFNVVFDSPNGPRRSSLGAKYFIDRFIDVVEIASIDSTTEVSLELWSLAKY